MGKFDKHQDIKEVHGSVRGPASVNKNREQTIIQFRYDYKHLYTYK